MVEYDLTIIGMMCKHHIVSWFIFSCYYMINLFLIQAKYVTFCGVKGSPSSTANHTLFQMPVVTAQNVVIPGCQMIVSLMIMLKPKDAL